MFCLSWIRDLCILSSLSPYESLNLFTLHQSNLSEIIRYSWVYAWGVPAVCHRVEQLGNRITESERGILFITFVGDKDFTKGGLHPRTELRSLKSMDSTRHHQFNMTVYPLSHPYSNFEFFQLMSYIPAAKPFLQLEFRNNKIGIRYLLPNKELGIYPIETVQRQKYMFTIEVKLPYVIVFMNGREVWKNNYSYIKCSEMWYQWGVYLNKVPKIDQSILFEDLRVSVMK